MMQVFKGNYRKAAEAVVIAARLYVLLRLFLYIVDPPFVLPAIMAIFILYCIFVYPRADRFLNRKLTIKPDGELEKPGRAGGKNEIISCHTGRFDLLYFLSVTVLTFLVLHFLVLYMHDHTALRHIFLGQKVTLPILSGE